MILKLDQAQFQAVMPEICSNRPSGMLGMRHVALFVKEL